VAALRERAEGELGRREDRWRPAAAVLRDWVRDARAAERAAEAMNPLKQAESWVRATAGTVRNLRFEPIAESARANWGLLRQGSNVEVEQIALSGSGTQRRVDLDVTIDGVPGQALGVMSQGELHALALGLFLPRASLPESPFRFVVIDDPVQAMDPAKVDGLARVLQRAAERRQVIVFTHDDRLPEAIRRLAIPARVLHVLRREGSVVEVHEAGDPLERYLDDALAVACTEGVDAELARRVVPTFCRLAIETACAQATRRRRLARGDRHADVEAALASVHRLHSWVSLAIFDDPDCHGLVPDRIRGRANGRANEVLRSCNKGAHQRVEGDLRTLVDDAAALARSLVRER
jgi:hypothetical protein